MGADKEKCNIVMFEDGAEKSYARLQAIAWVAEDLGDEKTASKLRAKATDHWENRNIRNRSLRIWHS